MATGMTFTTLQEDVRHYIERGQVTDPSVFAQIPRLINNAEREIAVDLKILGFVTPMTDTLVAGTSVYAKPDRWRQTVSMNFGAGLSQNVRQQLFPRSYEYCRQYWSDSDVRDVPEFYADYNYTHWLIVPTPVINYPWEANVWVLPALLSGTNQTNWLTDFAPTTLLYRTLLECEPFLKNDERIPVWREFYTGSKGALNGQDLQRIIDRNTSRERN